MKQKSKILKDVKILLLMIFLVVIVGCGQRVIEDDQDISGFSDVDNLVNKMLQDLSLEGASLIVKDKRGQTIYQKNYGSNFDETTVVPIASASKWLAGATVMSLVDESLIDSINDPISKYLPYFKNKGEKSDVTIRQTLAFTTGFPDNHRIQGNPDVTQQQECAFIAKNVNLLRDPGTGFHYGGLQEEIAGCVAEVVTGKPYAEIFQEKILDPLGMVDTQIANLVNRNPRNPDFESENPRVPGGVFSNAQDLIKFSSMILNHGTYNGKRILSKETINEMKKDQTFDVPLEVTFWPEAVAHRWHYGLGNWVQILNPKDDSLEEENKRMLSSEGALGTIEWVDFDLEYAAVFTVWGKAGQMPPFVNNLKNAVSDVVEQNRLTN